MIFLASTVVFSWGKGGRILPSLMLGAFLLVMLLLSSFMGVFLPLRGTIQDEIELAWELAWLILSAREFGGLRVTGREVVDLMESVDVSLWSASESDPVAEPTDAEPSDSARSRLISVRLLLAKWLVLTGLSSVELSSASRSSLFSPRVRRFMMNDSGKSVSTGLPAGV